MNDMKLRYYFVKALVSKAQAWERNGIGNYICGQNRWPRKGTKCTEKSPSFLCLLCLFAANPFANLNPPGVF
ncbi:MAG: hypothetical protein A2W17_01355 [Planctomycetes bacterium RBG_16_41_13]|nr:MAG: hypothetical protein A2W17_01355 [Planctomycetes bacterium RBG_16_41_13]